MANTSVKLTATQCLFCAKYKGCFFTETVVSVKELQQVKKEKKPVAVDKHIALLMKKGIEFQIVDGRLFDKEILFSINGADIRIRFNMP